MWMKCYYPHVNDLKYICTWQHKEEARTPEIIILTDDKVLEVNVSGRLGDLI